MIAIKDMEMPKDCIACPMQEYESNIGRTRCTVTCRILSEHHIPIPSDVKPDFCPLIEIKTDGDMISRLAAIEEVCNMMRECFGADDEILDALKTTLNELTAIYPERKTGRWIQGAVGLMVTEYKCSECGRTVRDDTGYDVYKDYPYCHCGAKMRKDGEE